ncbi:hypothetical protein Bca52824_028863 [Brassica carinata]|uniref:Uncharacterized protein n=1 Tax=Brassica carinata TaxID=52824 RepID=A0A8X8ANR2_BRACI|nr:hypothetical protein Bca52824_028863 [Brassica carinata]
MELKKEDLIRKERLSKLAILDTLLAKKEPLTDAEDVIELKWADIATASHHLLRTMVTTLVRRAQRKTSFVGTKRS